MADSRKDLTALNIGGLPKEPPDSALGEADPWTNPPKRFLIFAITWLFGVIGGIWAVAGQHAIAMRQRTVTGAIVAYQPADRNTSVYTFSIGDKVYTGREPGSDHKTIGEQVVVYYDPTDPERNRLKDFDEEAWGLLGPVLFMLVLSGVGIFFIVNRRRRFDQRQNFLRNIASQK